MSTHIGRAWTGHIVEDECPCPQEPCGLVDLAKVSRDCPQHTPFRTLRQGHAPENCPGKEER